MSGLMSGMISLNDVWTLQIDVWMEGYMDGCLNWGIDALLDVWMNRWMNTCLIVSMDIFVIE